MKREHRLKIISFIIALTLWYFIVWGKTIEKNLEIPIVLKHNQNNTYFYEVNPSSINVILIGTRSQFRSLNTSELKLEIDISKYPPGIYQIRVPYEKININPNIKIKEISPNYITLIIKKLTTKKVSVKVNIINQPTKSKFKIIVKPDKVNIKGFWEEIKDIEEIATEEIDYQELKSKKMIEAKLILPERVLEVEPKSVKIIFLSH